METFFKANRVYAVAGASTNTAKFGYKVLKWYHDHNVPVVPINPQQETILGISSVADVTKVPVPDGSDLVLSIVTPAPVTKAILHALSHAQGRVDSVWLQPGTYDPDTLQLARQKVPNVITDCILVKGESFLASSKL